MARSRRRRKGGSSAALQVLAGLAIAGLLGATGGGLYWLYTAQQGNAIDEASLCPSGGAVGHLAILVDTTDPISLSQLQAARQRIERKIADAPFGTRVSFSTVSPNLDLRDDAFFSMCKPQAGADASILTQNPAMIEARFQAEFAGPVSNVMNALLSVPEAPNSPIMESAQEFASRIPGFSSIDVPRELVLLSDLMQHSATFSFYRGDNWEGFASMGGPTRFGSNFRDASVSVLRIPRLPDRTAIVDDFWVRYFDAQGFKNIHYTQLGDL